LGFRDWDAAKSPIPPPRDAEEECLDNLIVYLRQE